MNEKFPAGILEQAAVEEGRQGVPLVWKALSVRQPWAAMIMFLAKDIENRSWGTKFRGRFLVHAAKGMTRDEWQDAVHFAQFRCGVAAEKLEEFCRFDKLQRGGFIGSVELVDSLDHSRSSWYMGEKGFLLRDPKPLPFIPYAGKLGFFDVPSSLVPAGH